MDNWWVNALWSITPTVLIGLLFWLVVSSIIKMDRKERSAYSKIEAETRAEMGLPPVAPKP